MHLLRSLAAFILAHLLAASAIGLTVYPWPECILYGLPIGLMFSVVGFPYLVIEIPAAILIYYSITHCKISSVRIILFIALTTLGSYVGLTIAPKEGDNIIYPLGFLLAGFIFSFTISTYGIISKRKGWT
jgi:hypothetical protein